MGGRGEEERERENPTASVINCATKPHIFTISCKIHLVKLIQYVSIILFGLIE